MRTRLLVHQAFIALIVFGQLRAAEPPAISPSPIVGAVDGKTITAADIGLTSPIDPTVNFDARDTARWKQMRRITSTFGNPIVERFVKERKLDATAAEIEMFKTTMRRLAERQVAEMETQLAKVKADLASPDLSEQAKAELDKRQSQIERNLSALRNSSLSDTPEELARMFIVAWKTERELHRVYGGRVIFQQAGPEALDGRRQLFEEAEKNGNLKFDDAGVRHMFYHYANTKHTVVDAKALEEPWFFDAGR